MFTTSAQLVQHIVQQHHHMKCKYNPRLSVFLIMYNLSRLHNHTQNIMLIAIAAGVERKCQ